MTIPDTTGAVEEALIAAMIAIHAEEDPVPLAQAAIAAHRKALTDAGGVELMPGEAPSWFEKCGTVRGLGDVEISVKGIPMDVYRLTDEGEDS